METGKTFESQGGPGANCELIFNVPTSGVRFWPTGADQRTGPERPLLRKQTLPATPAKDR
jgi:hypothetical protein